MTANCARAAREGPVIRITGSQLVVELSFTICGDLHITMEGFGANGQTRDLGIDDQRIYGPQDVRVIGQSLWCLAPDDWVPAFRQGFVVDLEPAMVPLLETWLPTLSAVAQLTGTITCMIEQMLQRELEMDEDDFLRALVASTTLDGVVPTLALYRLNARHPTVSEEAQDRRFIDALSSEAVQTLLHASSTGR
jgi:hypothetical protein